MRSGSDDHLSRTHTLHFAISFEFERYTGLVAMQANRARSQLVRPASLGCGRHALHQRCWRSEVHGVREEDAMPIQRCERRLEVAHFGG